MDIWIGFTKKISSTPVVSCVSNRSFDDEKKLGFPSKIPTHGKYTGSAQCGRIYSCDCLIEMAARNNGLFNAAVASPKCRL